jgi:hypothetical protein
MQKGAIQSNLHWDSKSKHVYQPNTLEVAKAVGYNFDLLVNHAYEHCRMYNNDYGTLKKIP